MISFTTDIWSSDKCPMSLLSLTAPWMDSSYNKNVKSSFKTVICLLFVRDNVSLIPAFMG